MSSLPDSYETLAAVGKAEAKIQRSRFLAEASPAADVAAAQAALADMRRRYHDARHVCSAWRLGVAELQVESRNDDGEPSGSAGEPILAAIRGSGLSDLVVCVARYFGGVKLGTGGLSRAYGGVAASALASAQRRTVRLGRHFDLSFDYPLQKTVQHLVSEHGGGTVHEGYDSSVHWRVWLPHSTADRFALALAETTAGRVAAVPVADDR
ncbi:MAG TPA: YigZ family protein [Candidatus Krumholzibacteria bacterium]|nr:YigZ family protein [Candidatus Krumholzibacteria bacterium]HPD72801.1 YigZ family protein [Candidatus Krumholzibacteria bacterium]HRY40267.1 YigZ family protein [Candidatus Krumholzibacteria bacterium]